MVQVASFQHVAKRYSRGILALHDVNLELPKGEFTFLTGPSGAGKTTFLKLLFGEERPTEGELAVLGHDMNRLKIRDLPGLRRRIGVVFQDFRLLPRRTTVENLDIALRIRRLSKDERQRRIDAILRIVELEGRADSFAEELSGGEQQRVAIARAISGDPELLLADEPTGNLDPDLSQKIMDLLRKIASRGTTVIVATHNYEMVKRVEARAIHIESGRVLVQ
ncbi:MAG: cell division ATP-binding protein FtsE [Candidatus Coatesbacteria bacterium RBG_13_66_14]|uniref:Cell division ATP-binding protein FtsE n=1 Tax=Candidatus Coatesbacteria bacterium RBG_13_66_14 TaxID=1817816 RepID=A0A1F5FHT9_9BACT|nr:MAG: cell division ATP-binding protein FtsE [Candidatus Coatesbacteria bacterium RBG_13_66_14]